MAGLGRIGVHLVGSHHSHRGSGRLRPTELGSPGRFLDRDEGFWESDLFGGDAIGRCGRFRLRRVSHVLRRDITCV